MALFVLSPCCGLPVLSRSCPPPEAASQFMKGCANIRDEDTRGVSDKSLANFADDFLRGSYCSSSSWLAVALSSVALFLLPRRLHSLCKVAHRVALPPSQSGVTWLSSSSRRAVAFQCSVALVLLLRRPHSLGKAAQRVALPPSQFSVAMAFFLSLCAVAFQCLVAVFLLLRRPRPAAKAAVLTAQAAAQAALAAVLTA